MAAAATAAATAAAAAVQFQFNWQHYSIFTLPTISPPRMKKSPPHFADFS
jgi:hypothetical protein